MRNEVNSPVYGATRGDELAWRLCHFISRLVEVVLEKAENERVGGMVP